MNNQGSKTDESLSEAASGCREDFRTPSEIDYISDNSRCSERGLRDLYIVSGP